MVHFTKRRLCCWHTGAETKTQGDDVSGYFNARSPAKVMSGHIMSDRFLLLLFVLVCVCVCVCIMNVLGQWWAMDSVCAGLYDLCQV